jgi:hypothetical protein
MAWALLQLSCRGIAQKEIINEGTEIRNGFDITERNVAWHFPVNAAD